MFVTIENLTNRPVLLRLNSGTTLHLAPRATSSELMDVEVNQNDKVKKLEDRHVIARHPAGSTAEKSESTTGKT